MNGCVIYHFRTLKEVIVARLGMTYHNSHMKMSPLKKIRKFIF